MRRLRWLTGSLIPVALFATAVPAQRPAGAMRGMGPGMGMQHDSATRAEMMVVHEMLANHTRITRTVTNLPDGIRTVTESDDPALAQLIREHVLTMRRRVDAGDDPGLPMESEALRAIYRNGSAIRTEIDTTARGAILTQTSSDSGTVAALQQHAAEVTALVEGGMAAMHEAMMRRRR